MVSAIHSPTKPLLLERRNSEATLANDTVT